MSFVSTARRLGRQVFKARPQRPAVVSLPNAANDARLMALKDVHRGRRAFLLGNGPSLKIPDIDRLKDEVTFASNKIYLAFQQTDWRPTYLTMCDVIVGRNIREQINALPLTKVFSWSVFESFRDRDDVTFVNAPSAEGDAAWDALKGFRAGHSVVNLDIKLAYWMGIREMYVIGLDFSFEVPDTRSDEVAYGDKLLVSRGEVNHFHPDYRKPGETWTVPKLEDQRREFAEARRLLEEHGGKIYNASRQTKLDVWERVDFDAVVGA